MIGVLKMRDGRRYPGRSGRREASGSASRETGSNVSKCVIDDHHSGNVVRVQAGVQPGNQSAHRKSDYHIRAFHTPALLRSLCTSLTRSWHVQSEPG